MRMPSIIITVDYELPGNGSGDVRTSVIEPTERLLKILGSRNIKMTVFFEIEEFLTFKKYTNDLRRQLGYDPALLVEEQLKKMVQAGHEIGLHIHPQWIGAHYDGTDFMLFPENQCLYDVFKTEDEMTTYLNDRVTKLKTLVKKYDSLSEITCFRAGGLALCPEKLTLSAIRSLGIKADSSVVAGLYRVGKAINVDYRNAPYSSGFWRITDNVCKEYPKGEIIEFPIYSIMKPEYKKLTINRIRKKFFNTGHPAATIANGFAEMALPKTPWGLFFHLFKKSPIKYDYCHMTSREMLSFFYNAEKENENRRKYPLTMIGHSKEFYNDKEFILFLDRVKKNGRVKFKTMGEAIKSIDKEEKCLPF